MISFVPTPLGNRGDITLRAIDVLKESDIVACEDTRHSGRLLEHLGINTRVTSLHEHNEAKKTPALIEKALQGTKIAVISDAGMPAISDPGYRLIQACIANKVEYTILPGPSSVLTALVGSGFPLHAFYFGGFLSVKKGKRMKTLLKACESDHTSIFFESPHRLISTLEILNREIPNHPICVARELTKKFETYHRGTSKELFDYFSLSKPKGELVILIAPQL